MRAGDILIPPHSYLLTTLTCCECIVHASFNRTLLHLVPDAVPTLGNWISPLTFQRLYRRPAPRASSCIVPLPAAPSVRPSSQPAVSHSVSTVVDPRTGQGARARGPSRLLTDLLHKNFTIHQVQRHHHLFSSSAISPAAFAPSPTFLPTWSSKPTRGELDLPSQSPAIEYVAALPRLAHLSSFTLFPPFVASPPLYLT